MATASLYITTSDTEQVQTSHETDKNPRAPIKKIYQNTTICWTNFSSISVVSQHQLHNSTNSFSNTAQAPITTSCQGVLKLINNLKMSNPLVLMTVIKKTRCLTAIFTGFSMQLQTLHYPKIGLCHLSTKKSLRFAK